MDVKPEIKLLNCDCMDFMRTLPDKSFDLAIVDPYYGIKESSYRENPSKCAADKKKYNTALWKQQKPNYFYFNELKRVSINQIVWGGNYFTNNLSESRCWIVWDKCTQDSLFADIEMAWTSFDKSSRLFTFRWNGMLQQDMKNKEERIHPTQKPVGLYKWILNEFATSGNRILDTYGGSFSHSIAAYDLGFDLTIMEIDKDYFEAGKARYEAHVAKYSPASEIAATKKGELKLF